MRWSYPLKRHGTLEVTRIARRTSRADPREVQVEVVFKRRAEVGSPLPAARDGVPVLAEAADVALRPIGPIPKQGPHILFQGHVQDAGHAPGIEVVLLKCTVGSGSADGADCIREFRPLNSGALDQETATWQP